MFYIRPPTPQTIERFRGLAGQDTFSYSELGATFQPNLPSGYNIDRNRICLGYGKAVFDCACAALASWRMFDLGWVKLIHPPKPVERNQTVLVLAHAWGLYSLSASRVIAMIDEETDGIRRWGFSYGTLKHHVEQGEERFSVELHRRDGAVWYDILAFSRPRHPFAKIAYPASRAAQRRFGRDSKAAMLRAVDGSRFC